MKANISPDDCGNRYQPIPNTKSRSGIIIRELHHRRWSEINYNQCSGYDTHISERLFVDANLSIAIPTFNRREFLLETLEFLLPEVTPLSIPIYISDNHSDDGTLEAVQQFAKRYYELIFINRNSHNIGFSNNLNKAVSMASTKYVWLMSDDDRIAEGAVSRVVRGISTNVSAIVMNISVYNQDYSQLLTERAFHYNEDIEFQPGQHEDLLLSAPPLYMSMVIDRSLWSYFSDQVETDAWPHTATVLRAIIGRAVLFIAEPMIKVRGLNESYPSNRKFEIFCIKLPKAIWDLPEAYTDLCKRRMIPRYRYRMISEVMIAKGAGWIDRHSYEQTFRNLNIGVCRRKVIQIVVLYLPRIVCQIFTIAYWGSVMLFSGELLNVKPRSMASLRRAMGFSWLSAPRWKGRVGSNLQLRK